MESTGRLLLALFLSMGAIYLWNNYYVNPRVEKAEMALKAKQQQLLHEEKVGGIQGNSPQPLSELHKNNVSALPSANVAAVQTQKTFLDRKDVIKQGFKNDERIKIQAQDLHGSINLRGLLIDDVTLAEFRETLDKKSPEVVMLSPKNTEKLYFIRSGWASVGAVNVIVPDENSIWKVTSANKILDKNNPVTVSWDNGQGIIFNQKISIDNKYLITAEQSVVNASGVDVELSPFALTNRIKNPESEMYISHEGAIAVAGDEIKELKYSAWREEGNQEFKKVSGWAGITDKYWLAAILPQNSSDGSFDIRFSYYRSQAKDRFQTDILSEPIKVENGKNISYKFNFYIGAKKLTLLEDYSEKLNIKLFDRAIDFGIYYFLTKPMLKALYFFFSHLENFGLAIMALTICVRLILFPIANKSYNSMARLRKHMPELQRMKEKHKTDKQKLGTEMMKYYKEHKINPMSGCLPMLIQIPVFFSLYKVLYVTIEMRHAPFYGWIKDLSEKDPTSIINLFGLLPFAIPEWMPALGVLPILFTLTMVAQQKLSPPPSDETQRLVMAWMPWIFLFVFSGFASGLVIYWIWNNILSILQQWIITKKVEEDKKA